MTDSCVQARSRLTPAACGRADTSIGAAMPWSLVLAPGCLIAPWVLVLPVLVWRDSCVRRRYNVNNKQARLARQVGGCACMQVGKHMCVRIGLFTYFALVYIHLCVWCVSLMACRDIDTHTRIW